MDKIGVLHTHILGSLDKFIYNKGLETIASLSWDNLYKIAKD